MKEEIKEGYKKTEIGEIPEEWEVKRLEEVCNILDWKRIPLNAKQREKMRGNIPYYGANGIIDYINDYIFDEELILLAEDGGNFEEYKNRPIAYLVKGKSWVNNHAHVLQPKIGECIEWIFYSLEHKDITSFVQGGTRSKLNQKDLKIIPIPYPQNISEQQKIASILSTVDEHIEQTDKLIEKTKELKKGLMQKLLTKGIGHTEFKNTEIGEIPKEWEVKRLGDIAEIVNGGTPNTRKKEYWDKGNICWATPTDITSNGKYIISTEKKITSEGLKNSSAKLLPIGSVLMTSRATIGECCINKVPIATNQGFKSFICKNELYNEYLYYLINIIRRKLVGLATGSTFLEISKSEIEYYKIPLPPLKEQQKIASILSEVDNQIEEYELKKEKLQTLKKGLMQQLLTGKIRVKV